MNKENTNESSNNHPHELKISDEELKHKAGEAEFEIEKIIQERTQASHKTLEQYQEIANSFIEKLKKVEKQVLDECDKSVPEIRKASVRIENERSRILEDTFNASGLLKEDLELNKRKLKELQEFYQQSELSLRGQLNNIDGLISETANRVLVKDYDSSSTREKGTADTFRIIALIGMFLIAILIGFSVWEMNFTDDYSKDKTIFSLIFSLILSVPTTYLARESAKHRQKYYEHLETSLHLQAIEPYVKNLKEDTQDKVKAEVAMKIFTPTGKITSQKDSYPINTQEVLLKLLDKLDFKSTKAEKDETTKQ